MILKTQAFARAGLVGNPSDGYYGKTISLIVRDFRAEIELYESPELHIEPNTRDISRFDSLADLRRDVQRHGYYGGLRLIKAALKTFADYCQEAGIRLDRRNFTVRYRSDIPRLVGLAGSSAIITAVFRALMPFYGVKIAPPLLANLVLSAERDELGIGAGLQDRVIQAYEGVVYMDFSSLQHNPGGWGVYRRIDPALLPSLYLAYDPNRSEGSEKTHNRLRTLFQEGDRDVIRGMECIAALADEVRGLLEAGKGGEIGDCLDRNYDLRASIAHISPQNARMVEVARRCGVSAKFAGSGGSIIGVCDEDDKYLALSRELGEIGCRVLRPEVV